MISLDTRWDPKAKRIYNSKAEAQAQSEPVAEEQLNLAAGVPLGEGAGRMFRKGQRVWWWRKAGNAPFPISIVAGTLTCFVGYVPSSRNVASLYGAELVGAFSECLNYSEDHGFCSVGQPKGRYPCCRLFCGSVGPEHTSELFRPTSLIGKASIQSRPEVVVIRKSAIDGADLMLSRRVRPQSHLFSRSLRSLRFPPRPGWLAAFWRVLPLFLRLLMPVQPLGFAFPKALSKLPPVVEWYGSSDRPPFPGSVGVAAVDSSLVEWYFFHPLLRSSVLALLVPRSWNSPQTVPMLRSDP
ncbi:hypothetical protein PIB30_074556 [Stylosanthes scabra]|uniref:Uncharacterized protein n=1 Tax=Stylosanthes scabra TaxID=79078 RepID=A0ABU6UP44_9FABA|nr:hypothetical protein [Stylosanthes scabra]